MRPGPGTSSPRCCPSASGSSAPSTRTPWPPAATSPAGPGRRGMRPGPATSSPRCCPIHERVSGRRAPGHPDRPRQPRPLDRGGGGCGRGPRPVRRAAARPRAGPGRRAPGHPGHPRHLARWTGQAGDAAGARDQYAALLPVRERVLGPEHPDTLTARGNLAHWTGEAGDAAGARDQYAALLPVASGSWAPSTRTPWPTRGNLAHWTGEAGDAAGARDQYAALLPVGERVSGPRAPGHPDRPRQPRPLDRGGGGCGRGPGPVRRAAARRASGCSAPSTRTPWPPAPTSPTGPRQAEHQPGPGCELASACSPAPGSQVSPADQRRITGGARASRLWFIYDIPPCP